MCKSFLFVLTALLWDPALTTFDTSVSMSDVQAFEQLLYQFGHSDPDVYHQGLSLSSPMLLPQTDALSLPPVTAVQTYPSYGGVGVSDGYATSSQMFPEEGAQVEDTLKQGGPYPTYGSYYNQQQPMTYRYSPKPQQKKPVGSNARSYRKKKPKKKKSKKKVYVPIVIRKKKKKKKKTVATYKGFYIPGGTQVFGKFKKIKDCKKICEVTPNCFSADYNPWLKKCYLHTNITACEEMRTHPKLIHFKKIPCDLVETPRGLITLGTQIFGGLQQKGIKSLQDCIKKCATAGSGISPDTIPENIAKQICFGIDYDFATHKCYFHTDETLCPPIPEIITPVQLVEAPSVINILLCPFSEITTPS